MDRKEMKTIIARHCTQGFGTLMYRILHRNEYFNHCAACAIVEANEEKTIALLKKYMGNGFGKISIRKHAIRFNTFYVSCDQSFKVVTPYVKVLFNRFNGFTELEFYATKKGQREIYNIDKKLYELSRKVDFFASQENSESVVAEECC